MRDVEHIQVIVNGMSDKDSAADKLHHALAHGVEAWGAHQIARADATPACSIVGDGLSRPNVTVE